MNPLRMAWIVVLSTLPICQGASISMRDFASDAQRIIVEKAPAGAPLIAQMNFQGIYIPSPQSRVTGSNTAAVAAFDIWFSSPKSKMGIQDGPCSL